MRYSLEFVARIHLIENDDYNNVIKEIKILKQIKHKNVIQLYEVIETKENLYIIMEFAEGGDFFDLIEEKTKFSESEALVYFHQIINAINC